MLGDGKVVFGDLHLGYSALRIDDFSGMRNANPAQVLSGGLAIRLRCGGWIGRRGWAVATVFDCRRPFPSNFLRDSVFAKAAERGLADEVVMGPGRETDLRD